MAVMVEAFDLSMEFRSSDGSVVRAVDRASLQLRSGQVLGLLGAAGAGKSMLLRLVGGEMEPTHGRLRVQNSPLLLDEPGLSTPVPPGQAAIIATRDPAVALALCHDIHLMDRGRVSAPRSNREVRALCGESPLQIRIRGHLPERWARSLHGVTITNLPGGEALLEGAGLDQAGLRGVLERVWDLGLPVVSVGSVLPGVEELVGVWG